MRKEKSMVYVIVAAVVAVLAFVVWKKKDTLKVKAEAAVAKAGGHFTKNAQK